MNNPQFMQSTINNSDNINPNYVNSRYAPTGNDSIGLPFPSFKMTGKRFTQWQPVSLSMSTVKKQMNLPTDTTMFRAGVQQNAIGIGNEGAKDWLFATQTLSNPSLDTLFCTSNDDCAPYGSKFSCNSNYESWSDSFGNQSGSVCSYTAYPEIDTGKYVRKTATEGGIGKTCNVDSDCAEGYECNNSTDTFGKNIQQTGFCSQTYECADGKKRYIGYPYNSGIPIPPPKNQNNNGLGYSSEKECKYNALAQQNCVQLNGTWLAVYPGYCPVSASRRSGGPQGALNVTSPQAASKGFQIPAYATNKASFGMGGGSGNMSMLSSLNMNSSNNVSPLQYELAMNPRPANI